MCVVVPVMIATRVFFFEFARPGVCFSLCLRMECALAIEGICFVCFWRAALLSETIYAGTFPYRGWKVITERIAGVPCK